MTSARFSLPLLSPGQSQKEVTHNEAIQLLECLVQPVVEGSPGNSPPSAPTIGQQFLIGSAPIGDWGSFAGGLASWTAGGWRVVRPTEGLTVIDRNTALSWCYMAGAWQQGVCRASEVRVNGRKVVGGQQAAIPNPTGGTSIDTEARATLNFVLNALRQHGLIAV
ncbi:DUF2793 domain-containing protein [Sphingomonas sp. BN140010]|uniref:DUF2793 domain-containing protein n=1 Tax=Sphingomonas arvum TaxID=2992113 RepID=A0ABT3JHU2_9SPHN|nr:DUF2793 domain-containing protein [Sphingomonas sp. BN140010]MCW3798630.1 DUF2793 domain-containing protein [Sphingomonas sp. BN140010]